MKMALYFFLAIYELKSINNYLEIAFELGSFHILMIGFGSRLLNYFSSKN